MPTKKAIKERAKKLQQESVNMSSVCDFLGKKCRGPIQFYLRENRTTGIRILLEADGTVSPQTTPEDPEFKDVKEKEIAYSTLPGNKLKVLTKVDLDISELTIVSASGLTETYSVEKQSSDSTGYYKNYKTQGKEVSPRWMYTIDMSHRGEKDVTAHSKDEDLIEPLVNAFVLAILSDRKENPEPAPDAGASQAGNGAEGNTGADMLGPLGQA